MIDLDTVAEIVRAVAQAEIVPRFRNLAAGEIDTKTSGEIVTIADRAAEAALSAQLTELLPGSAVVGEEAAAAEPGIVERLGDAPLCWLFDPVDGTNNFAAGHEDFVSLTALVRGGRTVAGWIYRPHTDDMFVTERGGGAYLNGERLTMKPAPALGDMTGAFAKNLFPPSQHAALARLDAALARGRNRRCIGLDYVDLVTGAVDLFATGRLYPWDHAACVLMIEEAGGHVALADGSPYAPTLKAGVMIAAPDASAWRDARAAMYPDGAFPRGE